MSDPWVEELYCEYCGEDDVFSVCETEFTLLDSIASPGLYIPIYNKIRKTCPKCGEVNVFEMNLEKYGLLIHHEIEEN